MHVKYFSKHQAVRGGAAQFPTFSQVFPFIHYSLPSLSIHEDISGSKHISAEHDLLNVNRNVAKCKYSYKQMKSKQFCEPCSVNIV